MSGQKSAIGDNSRERKPGPVDSEPFKRALTACVRAISGEHELEVAFTNDRPALSANRARLPDLPRGPTAHDIAVTRGLGDSMALRQARHNPRIHAALAPEGKQARAIYDAVEQARVEAIGARAMAGMADNLTTMLADKYSKANFSAVTAKEDAPLEEAVSLLLREKLPGRAAPAEAGQVLELWRDWIEQKAAADIARLGDNLEDQQALRARCATCSLPWTWRKSCRRKNRATRKNRTTNRRRNPTRTRKAATRARKVPIRLKAKNPTVRAMKASREKWMSPTLPPTTWMTARISTRKRRAIHAVRTSLLPILPSMSITRFSRASSMKRSRRPIFATRRNSIVCAVSSTSSLPICRAWWGVSPTAC